MSNIHLHVGRISATIGPLPQVDPLWAALSSVLSYKPEDSEYNVHLLRPSGDDFHTFPAGLAERVLGLLAASHRPHTVAWEPSKLLAYDLPAQSFAIRPYQASALTALLRGPRIGGILQAATGAGKTAMAAKLIQLTKTQTLFVVHTKDLLFQAREAFEKFLGITVGQIGAGQNTIDTVTVATIQTLAKGRHDDYLKEVQLAIFDECHHVAAPTLYTVRNKLENAPMVVGLSASPWRDDGHDMLIEAACGPVRYRVTASDLIEQGFLVAPEITVYKRQIAPELRKIKPGGIRAAQVAYKAIVTDDISRHRLVAKLAAEQLAAGRRLLILVKHIEHGTTLARMIPGAVFVEGSDKAADRQAAFAAFRTGELPCLIGTSLCDEGVDLPAADSLILAGAGSSSTRALQRIGRVLRTASGKDRAYVADIVDEHPIFRRQFYSRNRIYKTERLFQLAEIQVPLDMA